MLAKYAHYKDADDFNTIPSELRSKSLDPGSVSVSIALYVVFTILVNPNVSVEQYNELFTRVWFNYYETGGHVNLYSRCVAMPQIEILLAFSSDN